MALSYSDINRLAADPGWIARVVAAVCHVAANVKVVATAKDAAAACEDKLGREILQSATSWGARFALPVALGFLDRKSLEEDQVSDGALFAGVSALYSSFLPAS